MSNDDGPPSLPAEVPSKESEGRQKAAAISAQSTLPSTSSHSVQGNSNNAMFNNSSHIRTTQMPCPPNFPPQMLYHQHLRPMAGVKIPIKPVKLAPRGQPPMLIKQTMMPFPAQLVSAGVVSSSNITRLPNGAIFLSGIPLQQGPSGQNGQQQNNITLTPVPFGTQPSGSMDETNSQHSVSNKGTSHQSISSQQMQQGGRLIQTQFGYFNPAPPQKIQFVQTNGPMIPPTPPLMRSVPPNTQQSQKTVTRKYNKQRPVEAGGGEMSVAEYIARGGNNKTNENGEEVLGMEEAPPPLLSLGDDECVPLEDVDPTKDIEEIFLNAAELNEKYRDEKPIVHCIDGYTIEEDGKPFTLAQLKMWYDHVPLERLTEVVSTRSPELQRILKDIGMADTNANDAPPDPATVVRRRGRKPKVRTQVTDTNDSTLRRPLTRQRKNMKINETSPQATPSSTSLASPKKDKDGAKPSPSEGKKRHNHELQQLLNMDFGPKMGSGITDLTSRRKAVQAEKEEKERESMDNEKTKRKDRKRSSIASTSSVSNKDPRRSRTPSAHKHGSQESSPRKERISKPDEIQKTKRRSSVKEEETTSPSQRVRSPSKGPTSPFLPTSSSKDECCIYCLRSFREVSRCESYTQYCSLDCRTKYQTREYNRIREKHRKASLRSDNKNSDTVEDSNDSSEVRSSPSEDKPYGTENHSAQGNKGERLSCSGGIVGERPYAFPPLRSPSPRVVSPPSTSQAQSNPLETTPTSTRSLPISQVTSNSSGEQRQEDPILPNKGIKLENCQISAAANTTFASQPVPINEEKKPKLPATSSATTTYLTHSNTSPIKDEEVSPIVSIANQSPSPEVNELQTKHINLWTIEEVVSWALQVSGSENAAEIFRKEEIDGKALAMLRNDEFRNELKLNMGPSKKITTELEKIKKAQGWTA